MKRLTLITLIAIAALAQQSSTLLIPIWNVGKGVGYYKIGPNLSTANGQLDAIIPAPIPGPPGPPGPVGPQGQQGIQGIPGPPGTARRHVDVLLTYDTTAGGWPLPTVSGGAFGTNVAVYVNGMRYHAGADYSLNAGLIKALANNMLPDFLVTCDYDEQ